MVRIFVLTIYILKVRKYKHSNTRFNLTFVLSRKLLEAVAANAAPFLCNFRANFAAALRDGKGTNAG